MEETSSDGLSVQLRRQKDVHGPERAKRSRAASKSTLKRLRVFNVTNRSGTEPRDMRSRGREIQEGASGE